MKRLIIDLDGTITLPNPNLAYADKEPNAEVIDKLREYRRLDFTIVIYTSRNINTYQNSIGKINAFTLPIIIEWLHRFNVPYDEIVVGKPWCGTEGFYVDDRAIRPNEFVTKSLEEIWDLLGEPDRNVN